MGPEHRESERKDTLALLDFVVLDKSGNQIDRAMARTLNVSEKGILLETHLSLDEGQEMIITIGLGDNLCEIRGRVVRSEKEQENKFHYGVEFLAMDEKDAATLRWYLDNFNNSHP